MKLFVCGDIVNRTPGLGFVSDDVQKVINDSDYAVCNFEGPELMQGQKARCPHQEPGTADYLREVGFDLMLLSNNHITELGREGLKYSIDVIKKTGADYIGAGLSWEEAYKPLIREIDGISFGFINICEAQEGQFLSPKQSYGYAWMGYDRLWKDVKNLSEKVDNVVVFCHAGLEHYDIPLPEIRYFYQRLCDEGASVVIGGHTHSAQGYEYYHGKLIVYSLGNFFFPYPDRRWSEESVSYSLTVEFDQQKIVSVIPTHHFVNNGIVNILRDDTKQIDLIKLCKFLDESYMQRATSMCEDAYNKLCGRLLAEATCGIEANTLFQQVKKAVRYCLFRKKLVIDNKRFRKSLILRLFENETYRWTIIRALNKN